MLTGPPPKFHGVRDILAQINVFIHDTPSRARNVHFGRARTDP